MVLAAWSGFRRGALLQVLAWGGVLAGLACGALLAPQVADLVGSAAAQAAVTFATIVGAAILGSVVGQIAGRKLSSVAQRARPIRIVNTLGGALLAVVAVAIAVWFIAFNLVNGPVPIVAAEVRGSALVRALDAALPDPPPVLAEARGLLNRFGFPQVFSGLPPAPMGPVHAPTRAEAERAFKEASASTLRVVGRACDRIQQGSAFVVAENTLLTNAHVVAGVDSPEVQGPTGLDLPATTVLFDPRLDVAVLHVEESPGPVLALDSSAEPRGTVGAVVGYPGGGQLTGVPAAVRATIHATGRDIYGRGSVDRTVYQLQTDIRPGNSGGPFVLPDGRVAGLVFAASTTDPEIGYALTAEEIEEDVQQSESLTAATSTGGCLR